MQLLDDAYWNGPNKEMLFLFDLLGGSTHWECWGAFRAYPDWYTYYVGHISYLSVDLLLSKYVPYIFDYISRYKPLEI